jgi:tRNA threonylcarbamoyladenosine biosynthesis protein TsaE
VITVESVTSRSAESTEVSGRELAVRLRPGDVVLLAGDLAAGKTTFVRGLVDGLDGVREAVSSPSFVLLQSYDCHRKNITVVHHVDLYRLAEDIADLREVGVEEVLSDPSAITAVEWPKDALAAWIPADARVWRVTIIAVDDDSRTIEITPPSEI